MTEVLPRLDQRLLPNRLLEWIADRSSQISSCIPAISIPNAFRNCFRQNLCENLTCHNLLIFRGFLWLRG